jgi:enoyl-CoA hydratase
MFPHYHHLDTRVADGSVAVAAFSRPQSANALNAQMALELHDFFMHAASCRAIILTGNGKHFCAGADLRERRGMSESQWHAQHHAFEKALHAIMACPVPVIAAVNGAAFGGGLELALACDFIYAADTARFAFTETTLGIMPGLGGTQALPRRIGMARAKEILFSGKPFTAQQAAEWGMVNRVCTADQLMPETMACAQAIAANAPLSIKAVKQAVHEGIALPVAEALACELRHYQPLLSTKDRHEGIDAFNEKRKAIFTGE